MVKPSVVLKAVRNGEQIDLAVTGLDGGDVQIYVPAVTRMAHANITVDLDEMREALEILARAKLSDQPVPRAEDIIPGQTQLGDFVKGDF